MGHQSAIILLILNSRIYLIIEIERSLKYDVQAYESEVNTDPHGRVR